MFWKKFLTITLSGWFDWLIILKLPFERCQMCQLMMTQSSHKSYRVLLNKNKEQHYHHFEFLISVGSFEVIFYDQGKTFGGFLQVKISVLKFYTFCFWKWFKYAKNICLKLFILPIFCVVLKNSFWPSASCFSQKIMSSHATKQVAKAFF